MRAIHPNQNDVAESPPGQHECRVKPQRRQADSSSDVDNGSSDMDANRESGIHFSQKQRDLC